MLARKCPDCDRPMSYIPNDGRPYWTCDDCEKSWDDSECGFGPPCEGCDTEWALRNSRDYLEDAQ